MSEAPPEKKRTWWTLLLSLVGACFFGFLIYHFGVEALWEALKGAAPLPLLWCGLILILGLWVRAWKWRYVLDTAQQGMGLFFVAKLAGSLTPGRAGEFAPLLNKANRNTAVLTWILADRILEIWSTLAIGLWGAWYLGIAPGLWGVGLVAGGVVGTLVLMLLVWRQDWVVRLEMKWQDIRILGWLVNVLSALHQEVRTLRAKTVPILLTTAFAKWTDLFAVVLLCKAFGFDITHALAGAARCAHALVSAVPITPDVTGAPYVAQAVLLHEYGAMSYEILTVALALEAVMVYGVLYGSFTVYFLMSKR